MFSSFRLVNRLLSMYSRTTPMRNALQALRVREFLIGFVRQAVRR